MLDELIRKMKQNRQTRQAHTDAIDELDQEFGELVRQAFEAGDRGIGQRIADATGLTRARISQYRLGKR
ncbi:hypothetical protein [Nocardia sp. NPDC002869]|uniref:hypothetical protein n=1 Tax=Nocardia sp. NPDC002869 TaxID=3161032 RepID=UPI00398CD1A1